MSDDTDPAEAEAPARAPVLACTRPGNRARKVHGVPQGSKAALCGATAERWLLLPGEVLGCPACLAKLGRQVHA